MNKRHQHHAAQPRARDAVEGQLYRARWVDTGAIIYSGRPSGNLVGELPLGTRPLLREGGDNSLDRSGGDPFEHALFEAPSGRQIVVEHMPKG